MYLFFFRHFNDIDNIVPVVWKMALEKHPITVYCLNPRYDIIDDYRLVFIKEMGVDVDYVYNDDADDPERLHRIMRYFFLGCFAIQRKTAKPLPYLFSPLIKLIGKLAGKIGNRLFSFARKNYYDLEWATRLIRVKKAKTLCFDWAKPKLFVINVLIEAAHRMSIPTLALPHGTFVYTNKNIANDAKPLRIFKKLASYDGVVVENKLHGAFMTHLGLDHKKIHILGNARYCNEWVRQNKQIVPRTFDQNENHGGRLKVVFMTTKTRWRVDTKRMFKTFELIHNLAGIQVLIKAHTRTAKEAYLFENLSGPDVSDVSSVELCDWADVILVIASSIMLESLIQNKPVLYLKYLHENTTIYEQYEACLTINSEAELKDALVSLKKNKSAVPYFTGNVDRFISDFVYNGNRKHDILKGYTDFIVNFEKSPNMTEKIPSP
jgi:hypothetical protein